MTDATPLLEVRNVSIAFGGLVAVQNFSLTLPPQGLCGLIGPNGAGKTTIFNLLTGVYRPQSGSVFIHSKRIDGSRPHQIARAGLSRTFQNIRLFPDLSVLDNIRIGCQLRHSTGLWATMFRSGRHVKDERTVLAQRASFSNSFISPAAPTTKPATFRTAISDASKSPGPWPQVRKSCSSTSPPPA